MVRLDTVHEFALNLWSISPSPVLLVQEIDVQSTFFTYFEGSFLSSYI